VVIGIIVVLIAILLPVLGKAREAANRAKCASNLRSIGQAAYIFASNHNGLFPRGYVNGEGNAMPWAFNDVDDMSIGTVAPYMEPFYSNRTEQAYQKTFGLSLTEWRKCGLPIGVLPPLPTGAWSTVPLEMSVLGVLACPSADENTDHGLLHAAGNWTPVVIRGSYVYLGGYPAGPAFSAADPGVKVNGRAYYNERNSITVAPGYAGFFINSKLLPPACGTADSNSANRILAMDRVYVNNPDTLMFATTNHGVQYKGLEKNSEFMPKFVNVLFGDGHVEGRVGSDHYKTQWLTKTNANMTHATNDNMFWWGPVPQTTP
jgi:prepilin-type processing-associated H-X9-DG protein